MSAGRLDRRQLLKGLGASALAAGAAVTLAPTAFASDSVVGSWRIRIHQSGHTTQGVASFAPGGMMATTNANSPTTGLGVWDEQANGKFEFRFVEFDFSQGPSGVMVIIRGNGAQQGSAVAGSFSVTVGGHPAGSGTFDGIRM